MSVNSWKGCKESRARLCSVVSSARIRGNEHKLKYRRSHLHIGNKLFTIRVVKRGNRLCGDSILGDTENPSGHRSLF